MKKGIQEEVSRVKELMGILNEKSFLDYFGYGNKTDSIIAPIDGKVYITSPYGPRWGRTHHGIDIAANSGTNIKAISDGTVSYAGFDGGNCGGLLKITHDGFESKFCHVKQFYVSVGDKVSQGEVLALSGGGPGDPGRGDSTGAHVHYELYVNDEEVNPEDYLSDAEKTKDYYEKEEIDSQSNLDDVLKKEVQGKSIGDWVKSGKLKLIGAASLLGFNMEDDKKDEKSWKDKAKEVYDDLLKTKIGDKPISDHLKDKKQTEPVKTKPIKTSFGVSEIRKSFPCLSKLGFSQIYLNETDEVPVRGETILNSGDILYYREFSSKFKTPDKKPINIPIIFDKIDGKIVGKFKEDGKSLRC